MGTGDLHTNQEEAKRLASSGPNFLVKPPRLRSLSCLFQTKGRKGAWEGMKYVVKLGPEQEKHLLNNYLINSGSIASHCHPKDFIARAVTSHDLCS